MKARKFEDLIFWQRARELAQRITAFTKRDDFRQCYALRNQIESSSLSVMANIAEGFGRGSNAEFSK